MRFRFQAQHCSLSNAKSGPLPTLSTYCASTITNTCQLGHDVNNKVSHRFQPIDTPPKHRPAIASILNSSPTAPQTRVLFFFPFQTQSLPLGCFRSAIFLWPHEPAVFLSFLLIPYVRAVFVAKRLENTSMFQHWSFCGPVEGPASPM